MSVYKSQLEAYKIAHRLGVDWYAELLSVHDRDKINP